MWLMYIIHKNQYRIFKPDDITIRWGYDRKEKNGGMNQFGI
jgi:hypothetical protein